jgi:membrane protein required for beta-lactamase induction
MCMFCAAVPTVATLGLAARAEQQRKVKEATARGEPPPRPLMSAGKATAATLVAIVAMSVIYHTQVSAV